MEWEVKSICPLCDEEIKGMVFGYVGDTGIVVECPYCHERVELPDEDMRIKCKDCRKSFPENQIYREATSEAKWICENCLIEYEEWAKKEGLPELTVN